MSPTTLPHDAAAEAWVLGALLQDPGQLARIATELTPGTFFVEGHQHIYQAMLSLPPGVPASVVTVADALRRQGLTEGREYLEHLVTDCPSVLHLPAAAAIVGEKALRRRLIRLGEEIRESAWDEQVEAHSLQAQAEAALMRLRAQTRRRQSRTAAEVLPELNTLYRHLAARPGALRGLSTGFPSLDRVLRGLRSGQYCIMAGRPGFGKTTLALNILLAVARANLPTAIFSLEQPAPGVLHKLVQAASGVPDVAFDRGLTPEEHVRVEEAKAELRGLPIIVNDASDQDVHSFLSEARRLKLEHGVGFLVLDYLQLLRLEGSDRRLAIEAASRALKVAAGPDDLDLPLVVLSQLSRATEMRTDGRPTAADLKESGALEADADIVLLLWNPASYREDHPRAGSTEVIVAKNRNGGPGSVWLTQELDRARFADRREEDGDTTTTATTAPGPGRAPRPRVRPRG